MDIGFFINIGLLIAGLTTIAGYYNVDDNFSDEPFADQSETASRVIPLGS